VDCAPHAEDRKALAHRIIKGLPAYAMCSLANDPQATVLEWIGLALRGDPDAYILIGFLEEDDDDATGV
jgi:hypothetical protein